MDFSKEQLDYALLAANVYGAKSSVRTELNTPQLPDIGYGLPSPCQ